LGTERFRKAAEKGRCPLFKEEDEERDTDEI